MKDPDLDTFETELRKLSPAKLPESLSRQLMSGRPKHMAHPPVLQPIRWPGWARFVLWAAPAAALLMAFVALGLRPGGWLLKKHSGPLQEAADAQEQLQIEHELLASYQAVANLPTGEPVRFQIDEWVDTVTLRDASEGIAVERRSPRVEVIPVRFEAY